MQERQDILLLAFQSGIKDIRTGVFDFGNNNISFKDFWEWDQTTDIWSQKTNFTRNARAVAIGVSNGNSGYIGTGIGSEGNVGYILQDFWEYNP